MLLSRSAAVLLSGGIDSTSCAHLLQKQGYDVKGVFVDFGQASATMERQAVREIGTHLGIAVETIAASADTKFGAGELIGRNSFLIFSALLLGRCHRGVVVLGIHSGTPYFDCSPAFIERMDPLVQECSNGKVAVSAPFLTWSKDDIYSYFLSSGLPLDLTYSCERGTSTPCGTCASCKDRARIKC